MSSITITTIGTARTQALKAAGTISPTQNYNDNLKFHKEHLQLGSNPQAVFKQPNAPRVKWKKHHDPLNDPTSWPSIQLRRANGDPLMTDGGGQSEHMPTPRTLPSSGNNITTSHKILR